MLGVVDTRVIILAAPMPASFQMQNGRKRIVTYRSDEERRSLGTVRRRDPLLLDILKNDRMTFGSSVIGIDIYGKSDTEIYHIALVLLALFITRIDTYAHL